jgi:squalene-hopene/tetraprenyl-beta-curcumene cyclase
MTHARSLAALVLAVLLAAPLARGAEVAGKTLTKPQPAHDALDAERTLQAAELINNALAYLAAQREDDGGWSINGAFKPAVTALVLKGFAQHPDFTSDSPLCKKGFHLLLSYQQPDGAIYDPKQGRSNYSTAIAVCSLVAADDPRFKPAIEKAVGYLRSLQIKPGSESPDDQEVGPDHPYVGGVSYGKHGRPDLNNLGWWMEAMHAAGVPANDPDMQRALSFVNRCQNRSESNSMAFAKVGPNDGGFIYAPAKRDIAVAESKADPKNAPAGRGHRSYGSISYVAWKSMIYAGLNSQDPRVQDVYNWCRQYWTFEKNPNFPPSRAQQGMYFYYLALARALQAAGRDDVNVDGKDRNWRAELIDALARRVRPDGSFVNGQESRWSEGNPVLTTAYIVQALQETLKK